MAVHLVSYVVGDPESDRIGPIPPVYIPGGRKGPSGRVIAHYGVRPTLDALRHARIRARKTGSPVYRVDMEVQDDNLNVDYVGLDTLPARKFVNLTVVNRDVNDAILELTGVDDLFLKTLDRYKVWPARAAAVRIAMQPDLLNLLWDDPRFAHVNIVVWPAPTGEVESIKAINQAWMLAAVRTPDIVEVTAIRGYSGPWPEPLLQVAD